ncbi:MAG: hypothetical protein M0Z59_02690 [Nitrospiraceae bacterium]|nr:hypothetical protein [Nitrospiraceae bacterium]
MDDARRLKGFLIAGAAAGAVLGVGIALSMDFLYAGAMGGSWRQSIVRDLNTFLSIHVGENSLLVLVIFLLILGVLGMFGAVLGLIFSFFVYKFFDMLVSK